MFSEIRTAIIAVINDQATKIESAYRTSTSKIDGYPAAVVTPSENLADYQSTLNDRLTFAFTVRLYYPMKDEDSQEAAELALEAALDEMLDIFKSRDVLGTAADWVEPVPSVWEYEERKNGVFRIATITLKATKMRSNR